MVQFAVFLYGGSPALLPFFPQAGEQVREVLADQQQRLASDVLPEPRKSDGFGFGGIFREHVAHRGDLGVQFWRLTGERPQDADNEIQERRYSPLVLFEQSDGHPFVRVVRAEPIHQPMACQGEEVGSSPNPAVRRGERSAFPCRVRTW